MMMTALWPFAEVPKKMMVVHGRPYSRCSSLGAKRQLRSEASLSLLSCDITLPDVPNRAVHRWRDRPVQRAFLARFQSAADSLLEQRVRYITSGELLEDLTAALADHTLHDCVRFYAKFAFLIIDEFGFDRTERAVCKEAASLWYKIIDARSQRVSTALVTNIDFESWADYLGDAPLAMAMLDRIVHGATIVKLQGKSYRVPRGGDEPRDG
jgi:hypothetical protein